MMDYFAYGSNMSSNRLAARLPEVRLIGVAELAGYRLSFHKRGFRDGSGKCTIVASRQSQARVYGVLYQLDAAMQAELDALEGLGQGYRRQEVTVQLVAGASCRAWTYVATELDPTLLPFTWYLEHVLRGAREHRLPGPYRRWLEMQEALVDPDGERHRRELAIYQ